MTHPSQSLTRWLTTAAVGLLLGGCASGGSPATDLLGRVPPPGEEVLYPAPPQEPRVQFLLAISSEGDLQGRSGGGGLILKPYGLTLHNGRIAVCDIDLHGIDILDLNRRVLDRFVPGGQGQLRTPVNCAADPATGDLYVVDSDRKDVVVFDSTLTYVDHIGSESGRAADVFVDGDTVWVSDLVRRQVDVYDRRTRTLVRSIGPGAPGSPGVITQPTNIWVTENHLYVSDFGSFSVKVYDRAGNFERSVGIFGRGLGQFLRPKGIAVDAAERLYVVDAGFANVQVFDDQGVLLLVLGGPYARLGDMWLPAKVVINDDPAELARFQRYVYPGYELEHLILVTNQYGPDRISIYGFIRPADGPEAVR